MYQQVRPPKQWRLSMVTLQELRNCPIPIVMPCRSSRFVRLAGLAIPIVMSGGFALICPGLSWSGKPVDPIGYMSTCLDPEGYMSGS